MQPLCKENCIVTVHLMTAKLVADEILNITIPAKNNTEHLPSQVIWCHVVVIACTGWLVWDVV